MTIGAGEIRCVKPGAGKTEWFKDCPECPELVLVPPGAFTMGSPSDESEREPFTKGSEGQIAATISKPFAVGRFAVTRAEFAAFVAITGHKSDGCKEVVGGEWKVLAERNWRVPGIPQTDRDPVVCINWPDAKAYAAWLASATGKIYRLLSEAEREYVARAGTTTPFWWGSTITMDQAKYKGSTTVPVDTFAPNPWGLYNVHGNVDEWTEDCWNESNAGNPRDGRPRTTGDCAYRILRGGSWSRSPKYLRSANRSLGLAINRLNFNGFRVARTDVGIPDLHRSSPTLLSEFQDKTIVMKPQQSDGTSYVYIASSGAIYWTNASRQTSEYALDKTITRMSVQSDGSKCQTTNKATWSNSELRLRTIAVTCDGRKMNIVGKGLGVTFSADGCKPTDYPNGSCEIVAGNRDPNR